MIQAKYIKMAQEIVRKYFPNNKAFIFGSSLRKSNFFDVDIAIKNVTQKEDIWALKEAFLDSDFPRVVDIVDLDHTEESFRDYVLNKETKEWI